jgi:hypothetical protein
MTSTLHPYRQRLAAGVLLLALLTTGLSAVVAYLARTVLDADAFSARAVASLDEPGVSHYVALQIADGVVAANRDLTGVKPVIATFAQAVVTSPAFSALARRAAREAHRAVFSENAENVLLSMPDVGVLLRGTLETVSPEVAARVPTDVRAAIETRFTGAIATRVIALLRLADHVRQGARVGLVAGLLLIFGSIMLATERRQALLNAGIGLLAVAAVLWLVIPLGRAVSTGAVADPVLRAAVGDLWRTFTVGLRPWAVGLAATALTVIAGTTALLEHVALRDVLGRGVAGVTRRQASRSREAARVVFLLVLGAFAIGAPLTTLATAMVVAGALVLVAAVHELVALVAPRAIASAAPATPLRLNPALGIALGSVTVIAAGLGAMAVALRATTSAAESVVATGVFECDGAAALCDRRLNEITLAGAHNAMGSSNNPRWLFPNQDADLPRLLELGVRAFMLDVHYGHPVGDAVKSDFASEEERHKYEAAVGPEAFAAAMRVRDRLVGESGTKGLYMCHGFCELGAVPFDSALARFREFLVSHPHEVVLLILEDYVAPQDIAAAVDRAGLVPYTYAGPPHGPFPTLREMIERDQRLVIMGENETDDIAWYLPAYAVMQETPYTFHAPGDFSCRRNRGERESPIFLMNHWIESTPAPRPSNAEIVNAEPFLVARARECRRARGKLPNIIAVDFAATGDVVRAAAVLNGVAQ